MSAPCPHCHRRTTHVPEDCPVYKRKLARQPPKPVIAPEREAEDFALMNTLKEWHEARLDRIATKGESEDATDEKWADQELTEADRIAAYAQARCPPPYSELESFDDIPSVREDLLRGVYAYGLEKPSAVQAAIIPLAVKGESFLFQAPGGSGKTLAYVVPILQRILYHKVQPQALILVPSRELATQVVKVVDAVGDYLGVRVFAAIGGVSVGAGMKRLREGVHVVVGTPGRVLDMLNRGAFDASMVHSLVLDEVDDLLDTPDPIHDLVAHLPPDVQTLCCSSTLPIETVELCEKFMSNHYYLDSPHEAPPQLHHFSVEVDDQFKLDTLQDMYDNANLSQCIIFANTRRKVDWIADEMRKADFTISAVHGDMSQSDRETVVNEFRTGSARVLVTGDNLARGFDCHGVSLVVNYDLPKSDVAYVHRAGRAGRYGRKGVVVTYVTTEEKEQAAALANDLDLVLEPLPADYAELLSHS